MAARYSLSGSNRHRLIATLKPRLERWEALRTEPLTPVPISEQSEYKFFGLVTVGTLTLGRCLRMLRWNSFSERTKGDRAGMLACGLGGNQGRRDMHLAALGSRRVNVVSDAVGSSGRRNALPRISGISQTPGALQISYECTHTHFS